MSIDRRSLIGASLGLGAAVGAVQASERRSVREVATANVSDVAPNIVPNDGRDQTAALQSAIDTAAEKDVSLILPPGTFIVSDLRLRRGTRLIGMARTTTLLFSGGDAFVTAEKADGLIIDGLILDGAYKAFDPTRGDGLLNVVRSKSVHLTDLEIRNSGGSGLSLTECGGRVEGVRVSHVVDAGFKSLDSFGIDVHDNTVTECGNNGILIWRSKQEEDGSVVSGNRISKIRNAAGGTGQYGNGINVFRAGSVLVSGNRISDCAYTAVRGNAASNIQIIGNSCERLGEVALYAEFGFEGAIIANNLVDTAASGISVTNFNEGGRLAVVQGNLIRNLFRREQEPEDKRGEGISVEADAAVTGNTIENAPAAGIQIGWGRYMRDVAVSANVVRNARVGICVTDAAEAGKCLIANNLISQTQNGAIRAMDLGVLKGPDLAREPKAKGGIHVTANVAA
jgi:uncharacterized secreted repeat protein (TIGR03808 family)